MKHKKMTNRHVLVQFVLVTMLFSIVACQENDDEGVVSGDENNDVGCKVIVHQMDGSEGISLSKRKNYKCKVGEVFLYNYDTEKFDIPYRTLKISDLDGKVMQEWLLSDFNEDYFDDKGQLMLPNEEDATKSDFFYKWQGDIYAQWPSVWNKRFVDENRVAVTGFHILNVIDLQKISRIVGDFSEACDTLKIKPFGYYTGPRVTHWHSDKACLWLSPVSATTQYYGMAANSNSECGVLARITPGADSFATVYTNIKDLYARVRLVRDIPKGQW